MRDVWDDNVSRTVIGEVSRRTGFSENEQFQEHSVILTAITLGLDEIDQMDAWEDYISAFVNGETLFSSFFEEWNIDPDDFLWANWREIMGYSTNK